MICLIPCPGGAEAWSTAGLSFSDAPGGARDDPIILIEEISGAGPAVPLVRNSRSGDLPVSPARGVLSLAVVKIIANRDLWAWSGFDLELRRTGDQPTGYTDGLSDEPRRRRAAKRASGHVDSAGVA